MKRQHRFGVGQRELLSTKGEMPPCAGHERHSIPRTLAVIRYGDLDVL
ncbi:MAG: hypothetical protein ACLSEY_00255 [Enterocloster sp.]